MRQSGNESCSVFFSEIQAGGIALGMWCLSYNRAKLDEIL